MVLTARTAPVALCLQMAEFRFPKMWYPTFPCLSIRFCCAWHLIRIHRSLLQASWPLVPKTTRQKKNPDFSNNESREAQTSMLYMSRIFLARKLQQNLDFQHIWRHEISTKKKWYSSKIWFAVMSSSVEYPWVVWNQLCTRQAVLRAVKGQKVAGALGWFNIPNQSFKIIIILSLSDIFELTGMRMPSLWHGHFYLNSLTFELLTALTGLLGLMQHATVGMSPLQLGFVPLYITFLLQTKKKSLSFHFFGNQAGSLIWYLLVRDLSLKWNERDEAEVCTRSPTLLEGRPSCRVASTGYFQVHSLGSSGVLLSSFQNY